MFPIKRKFALENMVSLQNTSLQDTFWSPHAFLAPVNSFILVSVTLSAFLLSLGRFRAVDSTNILSTDTHQNFHNLKCCEMQGVLNCNAL